MNVVWFLGPNLFLLKAHRARITHKVGFTVGDCASPQIILDQSLCFSVPQFHLKWKWEVFLHPPFRLWDAEVWVGQGRGSMQQSCLGKLSQCQIFIWVENTNITPSYPLKKHRFPPSPIKTQAVYGKKKPAWIESLEKITGWDHCFLNVH